MNPVEDPRIVPLTDPIREAHTVPIPPANRTQTGHVAPNATNPRFRVGRKGSDHRLIILALPRREKGSGIEQPHYVVSGSEASSISQFNDRTLPAVIELNGMWITITQCVCNTYEDWCICEVPVH